MVRPRTKYHGYLHRPQSKDTVPPLRPNYMVRGACAPLMDSECHSMKTLVNAIDYACRLREGPGNKNISLGSVLKLLLVSHIAVVFAALLVVAVAKSHCIIWQLLWLPELLT